MSTGGDDNFLRRWSQRKHAVRRGETPGEPPPPAAAPATVAAAPAAPAGATTPAGESAGAAAPPVELPPVESLKGLESDYQAFLRPEVDAATRSAALRKLFADPHFNLMDRLDVYIDDYSIPDPIPDAMLRGLTQARSLRLFDAPEEEAAASTAAPGAASDAPGDDVPRAPRDDDAAPAGVAEEPSGAEATTTAADIPPVPASEAPVRS